MNTRASSPVTPLKTPVVKVCPLSHKTDLELIEIVKDNSKLYLCTPFLKGIQLMSKRRIPLEAALGEEARPEPSVIAVALGELVGPDPAVIVVPK